MSLQQIQQLDSTAWTKLEADSINFGFNTHTFWFRLDIASLKLDSSVNWMLELRYPLLNYVDVYVTKGSEVRTHYATGNKLAAASRPVRVPEFVFPLTDIAETDWVYIRVQSESSIQLPISLYQENQYWQQRVPKVTFDAAFYAVLACMVIYNLLIYLFARENIYLLYSSAITSFAIFMAAIHGWTAIYLWPNAPAFNNLTLILSLSATAVTMAYFGITFLRLKQVSPKIYRIFVAYSALAAIGALSSFALPYSWVIRVLAALVIIMSLSGLFNGAYLWYTTRSRDVLLFFLAFSLLFIGFLLYSLQKFGIAPVSYISEHAIELGSIAQVILLALSMAERYNREKLARLAAQDVIINMQREANEVLDLKVKERTEDLEKANHRLQEESTTDALTQVRNRRYFDQQLHTLYHDSLREKQPLALLLIDIDHFKQFNDIHGHQIGDLVLQQVADTLSKTVRRPMDEVYRYGGEEFAVLLPDTEAPGAGLVAEQIRQQVERLQVKVKGEQLSVTVSIGYYATIPIEQEREKVHCQLADQALYQAKHEGRNCVRQAQQQVPGHWNGQQHA